MTDGGIYKQVSNRIHGNGAIGGYGVTHLPLTEDDWRARWHPAPWWARLFGYKWRRWNDTGMMPQDAAWEYGTDKKVADEMLHKQFAPKYGAVDRENHWRRLEGAGPLPTSDPQMNGALWNNKGVISMSTARRGSMVPTARRGGH